MNIAQAEINLLCEMKIISTSIIKLRSLLVYDKWFYEVQSFKSIERLVYWNVHNGSTNQRAGKAREVSWTKPRDIQA